MAASDYIPKRKGTIKRYLKVKERFDELYSEKRMRLDDVIEKIQEEFFIDDSDTVWRYLRTAPSLSAPEESDPNQLELF